jgi:signal transduction histidine kinase
MNTAKPGAPKTGFFSGPPWLYGLFFLAALLPSLLILPDNFFEILTLDFRFSLLAAADTNSGKSDRVVCLLIDRKTRDKYGITENRQMRRYYPGLVKGLNRAGALLIAFDFEFTGRDGRYDRDLADAFREAGNVIVGEMTFGSGLAELNSAASGVGDLNLIAYGGVPRFFPARHDDPGSREPFAGVIVREFARKRPGSAVPGFPGPGSWIHFGKPAGFFPVYSFLDVMNALSAVNPPGDVFRDRIVLVGTDEDLTVLPVSHNAEVPGVLVHAYAVDNALQGAFLKKIPLLANLLLLSLWLFLMETVSLLENRFLRFGLATLGFLAVFTLETLALSLFNAWLNFAMFPLSFFLLKAIVTLYGRIAMRREIRTMKTRLNDLETKALNLLDAEKMKMTLIETVVHDIKNNVATMEGSIQLLGKKYPGDERIASILKYAEESCTDVLSLTSDLLDVARLEDGNMKMELVPRPVRLIWDMALACAGNPAFAKRKQAVKVRDSLDEITLPMDPDMIKRVMDNLFHNAASYGREGGLVEFTCQVDDGECVFSLFSEGLPLTGTQMGGLFRKYGRLPSGQPVLSRGLGLFFCKLVMDGHGGRIGVEARTGTPAGNAFWIALRR